MHLTCFSEEKLIAFRLGSLPQPQSMTSSVSVGPHDSSDCRVQMLAWML